MKKIIKIKNISKNYRILIENNSIVKNILKEQKKNKKLFIIMDKNISYILKKIKIEKNTKIIMCEGGEKIKTIENYSKIISNLIKLNIDRNSTIIAIGGGTLGDLTGFVASTVLRGVNFILMPTTLLSQVDSSIGGKNGINNNQGKNLIGTFYQPNEVIIDPSMLNSLPKREIRAGYAEIIKHALINNKKFYKWLEKNYTHILNLKKNYIIKAIEESILIKAYFVSKDEKEILYNSNSRAMLNFGHTFGHALEAMNKYNNKLNHGEAISIGMTFALKISNKLNNISNAEYNNFVDHLKKVKLPYFDKRINGNKIFELMLKDKKNSNNKINLILLKSIGQACFMRNLEVQKIKKLLK